LRHFIIITTLLLWTTFSFGQLVQRQSGETAEQFASRLKPDSSTLTYKIIETKWSGLPVLVALYDQVYKLSKQNDADQRTYHRIIGTVFIRLDSNHYSKTSFRTIDTEGGDPIIETVFFANADKDKTKELIVIASWQQQHYEVKGTLYGTFAFDHELTSATLEWNLLEDISNQLSGGCECSWSDGTSNKAKFKTENDIKTRLLRLGYKQ
jgi:hypothetical protein